MSKTVLVTGGAGFIGSHVVELLIEHGFKVIVFDNESTGERLCVNPEAQFVHGDVRDEDALSAVFKHGIDVVMHIAGQASIRLSFMYPESDLSVNTLGTLNVLKRCLHHHVPRLLFASSMTIYGTPTITPTPEAALPSPLSYYAVTKYAAERYVHITAERKDLDFALNVTSLRMFNVYGPRQSLTNAYQGVLAIFIGNVLRGEPITIHSDGEQSRDFVHITDVAHAWVDAIEATESYGQVVNIGSSKPTSVNQLCDYVLESFGHTRNSYPVRYQPAQLGDIRNSAADITLAERLLGWKPCVAIQEGIAETTAWAKRDYANRELHVYRT
jgi:UDP-glucose 4-epimerase